MTTATLERPETQTESKEQVQINKNERQAQTREPRRVVAPVSRVSQNDSGFTLVLEMPGVRKESLDINLEGAALTVQASSDEPAWENYETAYREFDFVDYEASFRLPNGLDREAIKADFSNGMLQIVLPKSAEQMPRKISINAQ